MGEKQNQRRKECRLLQDNGRIITIAGRRDWKFWLEQLIVVLEQP
jgi:hypothetical protein